MRETKKLRGVIRKALERELTKMQQEGGHLHDGWTGPALATWISAGVIASVERYLRQIEPPKPKRRK